MKKTLSLLMCGLLLLGCSDKYDDSALRNDLNDLENRLTILEERCKQMNTNISSLQTIITALQNNDYITSVTPITNDGEIIGYTITFAKSNSITIYNGTDGKDGEDGVNGEDGTNGKDGVTPTIGVKQDTDGVYYWTLNGDWLKDDKGNKIKAEGTDGKDGADGSGGEDGTNGKDGVTPKLEIREGYWWISYDNGTNWTQLGKATGEDGKDGTDGKDGSSIFKSVTEDDENVYFTLADDTIITIPKSVALSIRFDSSDLINISAGETKTLNYTITSSSETVTIETFEQAGWKVEITEQTKLTGTIAITAPNPIRDGKILIILTDAQNNSYMKTITLKGVGNTITTVQDTYTVDAAGGLLDVAVTANIDYTIQIPQDAKTWLSVQSQGENIRFSVAENESYDGRSADITLAGVDGTTSYRVTIAQLQKDAIILSESNYELTYEQQTLQVVLQSNTDLLVTIPETDTWITHISTRAMTERTLNFNIASNDGSQSRTGYITIQNADKNVSQTITIVQKGDVADVLTFEDPLFKAYLTANFDTNGDKEIDTKEALKITSIKCNGKSIYSLKGVEYFANLKTLDCSNNSVVELDLTQNTQLTEVKCFTNSLVDLKIGGLENLSYLDCNTNSLTAIDTNMNPALTYYNCASNVIKALDVSNNTKLEKLYCHSCRLLTSLNIKNCGNLSYLYLLNGNSNCITLSPRKTINISTSNLETLLIGGTTNWEQATIQNNAKLNLLDVSEQRYLKTLTVFNNLALTQALSQSCVSIKEIQCNGNSMMTTLNIEKCYALQNLNCANNALKELNISTNVALLDIDCSNNALLTMDMSNNMAIQTINCSNNKITTFNIDNCDALTDLDCSSNEISQLNTQTNTSLKVLKCHANGLVSIDISTNSKLKTVSLYDNPYTAISLGNISRTYQSENTFEQDCLILNAGLSNATAITINAPLITKINVSNNKLKTIDLFECQALNNLICNSNELSSLDVSHNTNLKELNMGDNPFISLDMSNTLLERLIYDNGLLQSINVAGCENLKYLSCKSNNLTTIDVSDCVMLTELECSYNPLTDIRLGNSKVSQLGANSNSVNTESSTAIVIEGINVKKIYLSNNSLKSIDIARCPSATIIDCSNNPLELLSLGNANITALNLASKLPMSDGLSIKGINVKEINIASNNFKTVNIAECPNVEKVNSINNPKLITLVVNSTFDLRNVETSKDYSTRLSGSNTTYNLGDVLLLNGGGIVCVLSDGGIHGKILSKDESSGRWSTQETDTRATSTTDGYYNTNQIKKLGSTSLYPAISWCINKGASWYLPSQQEFKEIYNNKSSINWSLDKLGYSLLSGSYWTSTEMDVKSAYYGEFTYGGTPTWGKSYIGGKIRAITTF